MSDKGLSKDILNTVKKKTGKQVSEKDIYNLANGVKPSTVKNEAQLRHLIQQVSSMVNVPVSDATVNEIVSAVKKSNLNPQNLEQMMKMMMGK